MTILANSRPSTAFQRTPKEVFAVVFELVTAGRSIRDLRTLTLVCRAWYELAISLPKLWTYLPITMYTTARKLLLWIERSRDHTLDIQAPAPDVESLIYSEPLAHTEDVQDAMIGVMTKCGSLSSDCMTLGKETSRGLEWVEKLEGWSLDRMEHLRVLFSVEGMSFPSNCSMPILRSLTLGRGTCKWTLAILPLTASTLKSFTLENVESSYALSIPELLKALDSVPKLESLRIDEVEWTHSDPNGEEPSPVTLPHLTSLSLTTVDDILDLVLPLKVPLLNELVIGDIDANLGPVFAEFAQKTPTIQKLRTGMWEEEFKAQSANGLIQLLEKTRTLQSLAVGNALIDRTLVQRLMKPATGAGEDAEESWLCPDLVNLELSTTSSSEEEVRTMVESRAAAGMRLDTLTLIGKGKPRWDMKALSPYVGRLKVEKGENA